MKLCKKFFIVYIILSCANNHKNYDVCLMLNHTDNINAKNGIDWWKENITYTCPATITVKYAGEYETTIRNKACGWNDGTTITWKCGDIYTVVRHEFGHILGYGDSPFGVMSSGTDTYGHMW